MTDDIVRAVVQALEPRFAGIEGRFAGIEARLDQCASKDDLRQFVRDDKFERAMERSDAKFEHLIAKMEDFRVAMERGLGGLRADMAGQRADLLKWMFIFWAGQAFVVLAYFRAGEYLAGR